MDSREYKYKLKRGPVNAVAGAAFIDMSLASLGVLMPVKTGRNDDRNPCAIRKILHHTGLLAPTVISTLALFSFSETRLG